MRRTNPRERFAKKKSLGQHFLTSPAIASRIAESAALSRRDSVLEIGPGEGMLTRELLARAGKVVALEKDRRLIATLAKTFQPDIAAGRLRLVEGDALAADFRALGLPSGFKVVANIPYYITGSLLRKLLTAGNAQPTTMVLLVQKEVAERIVAKKKKPLDSARGKESLLSLSVKAYGIPNLVGVVKRGSFSPPPKVDSAILGIFDISRRNFRRLPDRRFFGVLRAGFAHKRKFLAANLAPAFGKERVADAFQALSLPKTARAEDISLPEWLALAAALFREPAHGVL